MRKFLCLLLAVLMLASLCACGKDAAESGTATGGSENNYVEAQANLNPTFINWGSRRNTLVTSDPWYPGGKLGEDYIYFDLGPSSSGCVFYQVTGGQQTGPVSLELTKKNHLITEGESPEMDFLFHDEFHVFDDKSQTWYVRANPEFMQSLFVGFSFVEKNDSGNTIVFNQDGSALEVYQGVEYPGTWKIVNATTVRFIEGDGEYEYDFELVINSANQLDCLDEYGNRKFVYAK